MSLLMLYGLFALATGLTATYELGYPVLVRRAKETNKPVENIIAHYIAIVSIFTLLAPLILLPCLVPSMGERFRNTLYNNLFQD